jgi:uncharacterized protein (DUF433 family)
MTEEIKLVDRGRGLQLSTSRITVMDLVQYFRYGYSYDEIKRWIPVLTDEEIAVVETYYREHKEVLDERDRQIDARREELAKEQRRRFPELTGTSEERRAQLWQRMRQRKRAEQNGERTAG